MKDYLANELARLQSLSVDAGLTKRLVDQAKFGLLSPVEDANLRFLAATERHSISDLVPQASLYEKLAADAVRAAAEREKFVANVLDRVVNISRGPENYRSAILDQGITSDQRLARALQYSNPLSGLDFAFRDVALTSQIDAFTKVIERQLAALSGQEDMGRAAADIGLFTTFGDDFDMDEVDVGPDGTLTVGGRLVDATEVARAIAEVVERVGAGATSTLRDLLRRIVAAIAALGEMKLSDEARAIAIAFMVSIAANVLTPWLAIMLPWLLPPAAYESEATGFRQTLGKMRVIGDEVPVHELADIDSDAIGEVKRDAIVEIDEWEGGWAHIECHAGEAKVIGWIAGIYLTPKIDEKDDSDRSHIAIQGQSAE